MPILDLKTLGIYMNIWGYNNININTNNNKYKYKYKYNIKGIKWKVKRIIGWDFYWAQKLRGIDIINWISSEWIK